MNKFLRQLICLLTVAAFALVANGAEQEAEIATYENASTNVDPLMDKLDRNKDGVVDSEEAANLDGLTQAFEAVDLNKDSRLDGAELSQFLTPTPQAERPLPERR